MERSPSGWVGFFPEMSLSTFRFQYPASKHTIGGASFVVAQSRQLPVAATVTPEANQYGGSVYEGKRCVFSEAPRWENFEVASQTSRWASSKRPVYHAGHDSGARHDCSFWSATSHSSWFKIPHYLPSTLPCPQIGWSKTCRSHRQNPTSDQRRPSGVVGNVEGVLYKCDQYWTACEILDWIMLQSADTFQIHVLPPSTENLEKRHLRQRKLPPKQRKILAGEHHLLNPPRPWCAYSIFPTLCQKMRWIIIKHHETSVSSWTIPIIIYHQVTHHLASN